MEHKMRRLFASFSFLLISTLAYAQTEPVAPTPPSPSASGTVGDSWLLIGLAIAFVAVAIGVYLFIKRGGRLRM